MASPDVVAHAQSVLATVRADPTQQSRFARMYAGPGDALIALAEVADPQPAAESARNALRAVAFGRAVTADETTRALRAQEELDLVDAAAEARDTAIAHALAAFATPPASVASAATVSPADADNTEAAVSRAGSRAGRRRWRTPVLAATAFVLGAALSAGAFASWNVSQPTTSPTYGSGADGAPSALADGVKQETGQGRTDIDPGDTGMIKAALAMSGGDLDAANAILDRPRTRRDAVPILGYPELDESTTRRLFGGTGVAVFAGRGTQGGICVVAFYGNDGHSTGCMTDAEFTAFGYRMEAGYGTSHIGLRWDGKLLQIVTDPD